MSKYNVWLYVTDASSTGNKEYFHLGGDAEGVAFARKICPRVVASELGLIKWLEAHTDKPPSWSFKNVGGPATTKNEIKKLMQNVK